MLTTSCHCGAIRLEFARRPRKLTQCNCSMCRRYGAIWAYYRRKSVRVVCPRNALSVYAWGYKRRQFYRCKNCGSVTHYESARKRTDGSDWLAINVRNIDDPESVATVPIKMLDGASTCKRRRSVSSRFAGIVPARLMPTVGRHEGDGDGPHMRALTR